MTDLEIEARKAIVKRLISEMPKPKKNRKLKAVAKSPSKSPRAAQLPAASVKRPGEST